MDGCDRVSNGSSLEGYQSFTRLGIPNYWAYARHFVLGDYMFSSLFGPTFPAHLYAVGATSKGIVANRYARLPGEGNYCSKPGELVERFKHLGHLARERIMRIEESPNPDRVTRYWRLSRSCLDFKVLPDELSHAGVSWKLYDENTGWFDPLLAIRHIYHSKDYGSKVIDVNQSSYVPNVFRKDVQANKLPAVSWLMPPPGDSEHPGGSSVCHGENWTVRQLNALMHSPQWGSTVVFITWDDFGGLYDHVAPPHLD